MNRIFEYVIARLKEPSSVRGFIWLASGLGLISKGSVSDISSTEAIVTLAMLAAGVIGVVTKDKHLVVTNANTVVKADNVEQAETVIESGTTTERS